MNKEEITQIEQYYERIEKLLSGSNKKTYGFSPEEIRQILKWYEVLQQRINKAIHRIQLLQMDNEVTVRDLGLIVRDLKGDKEC